MSDSSCSLEQIPECAHPGWITSGYRKHNHVYHFPAYVHQSQEWKPSHSWSQNPHRIPLFWAHPCSPLITCWSGVQIVLPINSCSSFHLSIQPHPGVRSWTTATTAGMSSVHHNCATWLQVMGQSNLVDWEDYGPDGHGTQRKSFWIIHSSWTTAESAQTRTAPKPRGRPHQIDGWSLGASFSGLSLCYPLRR